MVIGAVGLVKHQTIEVSIQIPHMSVCSNAEDPHSRSLVFPFFRFSFFFIWLLLYYKTQNLSISVTISCVYPLMDDISA